MQNNNNIPNNNYNNVNNNTQKQLTPEQQQALQALLDKVKPMSTYADQFRFLREHPQPRISTGFLALDKLLNGGLANELYIMAAETSTGKSAFLMQIAQTIARNGIDVLYFALEMGREEFVARGISSLSFLHSRTVSEPKLYTAGNVLYHTWDYAAQTFTQLPYSVYSNYSDEYFKLYGEHLHIIEAGVNGTSVKDIANTALAWKRKMGKPVVVFVDYLQILRPDKNDSSQNDRKNKLDIAVTTLKALASQVGMPVVTVSSVSRANYGGRISTASFKESGDVEYTGGVLIGWNWKGVTDQADREEQDKVKANCAKAGFREMSLQVLKFRNAARDTTLDLIYYPAYNVFLEKSEWQQVATREELDFCMEGKKEEFAQTAAKIADADNKAAKKARLRF